MRLIGYWTKCVRGGHLAKQVSGGLFDKMRFGRLFGRSIWGASYEAKTGDSFKRSLEPPGAYLLERMIVCRARGRKSSFFCRQARSRKLQGPASQKKWTSKARTSPRPRGYVAKLENLESVRGHGGTTRYGYEGYVAKRRNR